MGCSGKNHPKIIKYFHPLNLEIRLIIIIVNAVLGLRYFQKCSIITMASNLKFTWLFYPFQFFNFFWWNNGISICNYHFCITVLNYAIVFTEHDDMINKRFLIRTNKNLKSFRMIFDQTDHSEQPPGAAYRKWASSRLNSTTQRGGHVPISFLDPKAGAILLPAGRNFLSNFPLRASN